MLEPGLGAVERYPNNRRWWSMGSETALRLLSEGITSLEGK
jgi:hypothetical protein